MKKILFLMVMASSLLFGCKGEKGDTGTPGTNGNANVRYQQVSISNWTDLGGANNYSYVGTAAINLSQTEKMTSSVMVYEIVGSTYLTIPYSNVYGVGGIDQLINCNVGFDTNTLLVEYNSENSYFVGTRSFQVVVIPAGALKPIDYNNYEAVKQAHQL